VSVHFEEIGEEFAFALAYIYRYAQRSFATFQSAHNISSNFSQYRSTYLINQKLIYRNYEGPSKSPSLLRSTPQYASANTFPQTVFLTLLSLVAALPATETSERHVSNTTTKILSLLLLCYPSFNPDID